MVNEKGGLAVDDALDVTLQDDELVEEIALTAELMAAAVDVPAQRLSQDRIDAILLGSSQWAGD
jgi:hypothetical protein